jgi:hypothetical protein
MSSTYFIDAITPITAAWLNDVNESVYGTGPATRSRGAVTAIAGQTIFTVPFAFTAGSLDLVVYINGIFQVLGTSYTENLNNTITFSEAVPVNCVVEFVG